MLLTITSFPISALTGPVKGGTVSERDRASARFYVPPPSSGARKQISQLLKARDFSNAGLIRRMVDQPQAVWFTGGTPHDVKAEVRKTMQRAARQRTLPVLVAYNIPLRDCAQFSAGGATNAGEYLAWIDGFAAGIGRRRAIVILEPDGLGIIPHYDPIGDAPMDWCRPPEADPATAASDRFRMLNKAVDRLREQNVRVYLDGTHSAWLSVGDAAHRLVQAGVERADGFFLNVSNYRFTEHLVKYGTWISKCVHWGTSVRPQWAFDHVGNFRWDWCAGQYSSPLGPVDPNDFSTWTYTDRWYEGNVGHVDPSVLTHFVIDTSRNGRGHWTPSESYPDPQDWCNPPGRGLGPRPTAATGNPLVDAFLWVKSPGESDGSCTRGLGPAETTVDPEWDRVDPGAGRWFAAQALQLARLAKPPLSPGGR